MNALLPQAFDFATALATPKADISCVSWVDVMKSPEFGYVRYGKGALVMEKRRKARDASAAMGSLNVNGIGHLLADTRAMTLKELGMVLRRYNHKIPLEQTYLHGKTDLSVKETIYLKAVYGIAPVLADSALGKVPAKSLSIKQHSRMISLYGTRATVGGIPQLSDAETAHRPMLQKAAYVLGHLSALVEDTLHEGDLDIKPLANGRFKHFKEAIMANDTQDMAPHIREAVTWDTVHFVRYVAARKVASFEADKPFSVGGDMMDTIGCFADRLEIVKRHGIDLLAHLGLNQNGREAGPARAKLKTNRFAARWASVSR